MSVTFTFGQFIETSEHGTVLLHGCPTDHRICTVEGCEDFADWRSCDHTDAAYEACGCQAHDVNLSNANAALVLERLGYEADDLCGSASPEDLLGRALVANVGRDDSGTADADLSAPGSARFIDCGVPAGYYDARMGSLAALATEALRRGVLVVWA